MATNKFLRIVVEGRDRQGVLLAISHPEQTRPVHMWVKVPDGNIHPPKDSYITLEWDDFKTEVED